ncbi:MAG: hypothetical protein HWE27_10755 [Gammaproteobacteria bacterium]|nr:hypothetical protein [Gammaproteobacteria bacterium]
MKSNLVNDLVSVDAPIDDYGNFKYGNIKNGAKYNLFDFSHNAPCNIVVKVNDDISISYDKSGMYFYSIYGVPKSNSVSRTRRFRYKKNGKFILNGLFESDTLVEVDKRYTSWALSRASKLNSVAVELCDIATIKLLHSNYLSFHGGCVEYNDRGYVITGLPDMGKTLTTMKLLENEDYKFLSEDILLIDKAMNAYAVPFTQTVEKRKKLSLIEKIKGRIYEAMYKNNYVKSDILEVKPEIKNRIKTKTDIDAIFFLVRGERFIREATADEREYYVEKTVQLNHLEFTYFRNELILSYLFFNDSRDITFFLNKEKKMIEDLYSEKKLVVVSSPDAFGYSELIQQYIESE